MIHTSDEGTSYCTQCEIYARQNEELVAALEAVDIYFKALNEQWNANEGRVVSESGIVIDASADCQRLCNEAGEKVQTALARVKGK